VIKSKFIDSGDDIVDPYIARQVRLDVVQALGRLARGGSSMDSRANAARAVGILRGRAAIPDLEQALKAKDDDVIYESLVALRKIGDPAAGPSVAFRLRDPVEKVQIAAIETTGLLQNREAAAQLRDVFEHARNAKIQRAALSALAMMPDPQSHSLFVTYLRSKDDDLRAASAEGLARAANADDQPVLEKAFQDEAKTGPRLADAFGLVKLGNRNMSEFAPLRYLVNSLNSKAYRGVAQPYLSELARNPATRQALYPALNESTATRDEKTGLAQVFANSGDRDSMPYLETLSKDTDDEISRTGLKAIQTLQSRL
jgi:HEAT repeat protein